MRVQLGVSTGVISPAMTSIILEGLPNDGSLEMPKLNRDFAQYRVEPFEVTGGPRGLQ
jgi:hypothetical protein